jgi:flagellar biosynthesis GTPase FlhF
LPPSPEPLPLIYDSYVDTTYNLGPSSYVFIPSNTFISNTYIHVCRPVHNNITIIRNTVNVTRIICSRDKYRRPVHLNVGGPRREEIERVCHRPPPRARVELHDKPLPVRSRDGHGPAVIPLVHVPDMPANGARRQPPIRERGERIANPTPVDTFAGVSPEERKRLREEMGRNAESRNREAGRDLVRERIENRNQERDGQRPGLEQGEPRQREETERLRVEQARREQMEQQRRQQIEEARKQAEEAAKQQEEARREQMEQQRRQQQEEMQRRQEQGRRGRQ